MPPLIHKLNETDHVSVTQFLTLAQQDTVRPVLSEHKAVRAGTNSVREWAVVVEGEWIGYLQAAEHGHATFDVEVVVLSGHEHVVPQAVHEVCAALPGSVQIWGWIPEVIAGLERAGAVVERTLFEMRVSLPLRQTFAVPKQFELRDFRITDHAEHLRRVNNRAFAGHREAGNLTANDLAVRFSMPWFLEQDVVAAWSGDRLAGICWTKHVERHVGEIYVIGVDPDFAGSGLGRALVSVGLQRQQDRYGVTTGSLWTDADNRRAVGMYRSMGFEVVFANKAYGCPATQP